MSIPFGLGFRIETTFGGWGGWDSRVEDHWISDLEGYMTEAADRRIGLLECAPEDLNDLNLFRSEWRAKQRIALLVGGTGAL